MKKGAMNDTILAISSHVHANGKESRITASDDAMAIPHLRDSALAHSRRH